MLKDKALVCMSQKTRIELDQTPHCCRLCSCVKILRLQARLDAFRERLEIAHSLNFVIGQFDIEVIFQPRKQVQRLQAVNPKFLIEVIPALSEPSGSLNCFVAKSKISRVVCSNVRILPQSIIPRERRKTWRAYSKIKARRIPFATASIRVSAPSFLRIDAT